MVGAFFLAAGLWVATQPAISQSSNKEPDVVFDMKCVATDKDGNYKTVYTRYDILDFTTSSDNGDVVFTLFFSDDRKSYELVPVEPNTLCSVSKRIEVK
jgi:hypothetical protein